MRRNVNFICQYLSTPPALIPESPTLPHPRFRYLVPLSQVSRHYFLPFSAPKSDPQLYNSLSRNQVPVYAEDESKETHHLFYDGESVTGKVDIKLKQEGKKLEHQGIKIEFLGLIEIYYDRGNHYEFVKLDKDLTRPGMLTESCSFPFEFLKVVKQYESYAGRNVRLRYHLNDVIVGKIYFILVRIKIKHMELSIIKRETTGSGPNTYNENEQISRFEIMDGAPVRGESIPIRLFLSAYDLTPTMKDVNKKFSVRYYLNLVLVDEEDRRYFKQQGDKSDILVELCQTTQQSTVNIQCVSNLIDFLTRERRLEHKREVDSSSKEYFTAQVTENDWQDVPSDQSKYINDFAEGKVFQIETNKAVDFDGIRIWFNKDLELEWIFSPKYDGTPCDLAHKNLTGIRFQRNAGADDTIIKQYRYEVRRKEDLLVTSKFLST
eukprot:sb/3464842/